MAIKQVIVVRKQYPDNKGGLKQIQVGKEMAQVAHASLAFLTRRIQKQLEAERGKIVYVDKINPKDPLAPPVKVPASFLGGREPKKIKDIFSKAELEWMIEVPGEKSFAKIVLQCDSEEELIKIYEKAKAAGLESHLIIDSGATEFHGIPTKTCVGIGPDEAEKIDAITGSLKLR